MKTYQESLVELAKLKTSPNHRYVCHGAFALMSFIYGIAEETVYDAVGDIIAQQKDRDNELRKIRHRDENEARRNANIAKSA